MHDNLRTCAISSVPYEPSAPTCASAMFIRPCSHRKAGGSVAASTRGIWPGTQPAAEPGVKLDVRRGPTWERHSWLVRGLSDFAGSLPLGFVCPVRAIVSGLIPKDWAQQLLHLPYGSPEALDLVMHLSDAVQLGLLDSDEVDKACERVHLEQFQDDDYDKPSVARETPEQREARERERFEFLDRVCPLPVEIHYTLKEVLAMKLSEALKAIRGVSLEEILAELKTAEDEFDRETAGARETMQAEISAARAKYKEATKAARTNIKLLQRLKMSKEKAGKPFPKKKRKAG